MKILVATQKAFAPAAIKQIFEITRTEGHELLLLENYKTIEEFIAIISDADALIVRSDSVTKKILDYAPKLKIVVRAGAGYDNIDLNTCTSKGIVVMNTPGQNSNAVAELVFEMMLFMARGGFSGKTGSELRGKSLGIHAFGNVGKIVAEIGLGFGMIIYAFDPYIKEDAIISSGIKLCNTVDELYGNCQFVSLHLPANNETQRSVGYHLLKKMPPDPVLINSARKEIINEDDLLRVFEERQDFRYLADIEPDCKATLENKYGERILITSKKMGAQTHEANIKAGVAAAKQIIDYFKTGNEKFRVNK